MGYRRSTRMDMWKDMDMGMGHRHGHGHAHGHGTGHAHGDGHGRGNGKQRGRAHLHDQKQGNGHPSMLTLRGARRVLLGAHAGPAIEGVLDLSNINAGETTGLRDSSSFGCFLYFLLVPVLVLLFPSGFLCAKTSAALRDSLLLPLSLLLLPPSSSSRLPLPALFLSFWSLFRLSALVPYSLSFYAFS